MNGEKRKILKNPIIIGLVLFSLNMLAFFIVYYFFMDVNYWDTSMKVNSFVLPFLYTFVGFMSVYWYRSFSGRITFYKAFRQAFITVFIGGFLSISSIFIFLNYIDIKARDTLNYQYVDLELKNLYEKYHEIRDEFMKNNEKDKLNELEKKYLEAKHAREIAMKEGRNYFSFGFLFIIFGGYMLFYILLSVVIAGFLKNKKSYE